MLFDFAVETSVNTRINRKRKAEPRRGWICVGVRRTDLHKRFQGQGICEPRVLTNGWLLFFG
jgi:hypothetical protein